LNAIRVTPFLDVKSVKQVKSYADPTMFLRGVILKLERSEETNAFERQLALEADVQPDNKVVYEITTDEGFTFYVKLHDMEITFALEAKSR
jgi:hypothetical protein